MQMLLFVIHKLDKRNQNYFIYRDTRIFENIQEHLISFLENITSENVKTLKTRRKTGMLQFCPLRDNRTSARLLCCIQPKNASPATMLENSRDAGARKRRVPARSQRAPARRATRSAQGLGKPKE